MSGTRDGAILTADGPSRPARGAWLLGDHEATIPASHIALIFIGRG